MSSGAQRGMRGMNRLGSVFGLPSAPSHSFFSCDKFGEKNHSWQRTDWTIGLDNLRAKARYFNNLRKRKTGGIPAHVLSIFSLSAFFHRLRSTVRGGSS